MAHLSAIAPRIGDVSLLREVVLCYGRCLRQDQVPQVLRGLSGSLLHLASNLADVRPLEPLIPVVREVVEVVVHRRAAQLGRHTLEDGPDEATALW